jgi:hypothetical protein
MQEEVLVFANSNGKLKIGIRENDEICLKTHLKNRTTTTELMKLQQDRARLATRVRRTSGSTRICGRYRGQGS